MSSPGWGTASAASTATHLPPPVPPKITHSAHSRPEDAKTDDIAEHQVESAAPRDRDTFLPQPSLSSPDPRSDMHWGLASTKLADDHESESGDVLQGGNEARVQAAGPQHEALYDGFPTERETEQMAERNRPRSRNSHARYYTVETPRSD
ncbi:hypothetical protein SEPCBS57363_003775 [Sporothrix epigloea]|uniref:Uncharacterized protein n=1 Tax=Sporothrix epigloea TaxID=1892477 RepID=A0ABP0DNC5_9PEZI